MAGMSEYFGIGSIVVCKTCYNKDIEGEVLAFDPQTKMLILKCPSSCGKPNLNNVHVVNLSLVSDVHVKEDVNTVPEPPQSLNLDRLNRRVRNQIEKKRRIINAYSAVDVTPEGRELFLTITKTIRDVSWQGSNIVVLDQVTITPPYKPENVTGKTDSKAYIHIRKVVEKHVKDTQVNSEGVKLNKLLPSNSVSPQ